MTEMEMELALFAFGLIIPTEDRVWFSSNTAISATQSLGKMD